MSDVLRMPRTDPQRVVLRINIYVDRDADRTDELMQCWKANMGRFDSVVALPGRPTYAEMFNAITGPGITVLANADIEFPAETVDALRTLDLGDTALALTRYNEDGQLQHPNPRGSQDSWVIQGAAKPVKADFTMGRPGCDNRFAHELSEAGYTVANPCLTLRTIHRHAAAERGYTRQDVVPRPYKLVPPCELVIGS